MIWKLFKTQNTPHFRYFAAKVKFYTHPNDDLRIITIQTFATFWVKRSDTLQDLAPRL